MENPNEGSVTSNGKFRHWLKLRMNHITESFL